QVRRQRAGGVGVIDALGDRVGDDDARARPLAQQGRAALRVDHELGAADALGVLGRVAQRLAEHLLELRDVGLGRGLEVVDALGAQSVLERRQQRGRRDRERQGARRHEGDQEPPAQAGAAEDLSHCSRKRYPAPRTVRIRLGSSGFSSSFSRRWRMWTSIARGSRYALSPQIARRSSWRVNSLPGRSMRQDSTSNSENVTRTGEPFTVTWRARWSIVTGPTETTPSTTRPCARRRTARM